MTQENISLQPGEEIKPIQGYESLYSITSFGRVWIHEKYVRSKNNSLKKNKGKFMKFNIAKNGYLHSSLYKENRYVNIAPHVLVATHFISNPNNLPEVNHKDTNKQNNHKDNLEWCTKRGNIHHAMKHGLLWNKVYSKYHGVTFEKRKKIRSWRARVTDDENKRVSLGYYVTEIEAAKAYNKYVIEHNLNRLLNEI